MSLSAIETALAKGRATAIAQAISDNPPAHTLADEVAAAKEPFDSALVALHALGDPVALRSMAEHVVACWHALGRCEDEFNPDAGSYCGEYAQHLDSAISAMAGHLSQAERAGQPEEAERLHFAGDCLGPPMCAYCRREDAVPGQAERAGT